MICADQKEDEAGHEGESWRSGTHDHGHDCDPHKDTGHPVCSLAKERVSDMSAIELSDRHHVQARDEQPDPAGHEIRIQLRMGSHLSRLISDRLDSVHDPPHGKWRIELIGARNGNRQIQLGDSDPCDRDRNDQTGERAGNADIEHFPTISTHSVHANHGTHRPNRADDGEWNEVRKAGRNSMSQGREKVPHLMR